MKTARLAQGGRIVLGRVMVARGFFERALGFIGRRAPPSGTALYLPGCRAVHTWGMLFAIDVRFLDREGRTVRVVRALKPWRMARGGRRAAAALETVAGDPADAAIDPGEALRLAPAE